MLDHVAVNVSDFETARDFYANSLAAIGYSVALEMDGFVGFADADGFALGVFRRDPTGGTHVAFKCDDRDAVAAFYEAAIAAGGTDNGPPGLRTHYHENYYAAFVRDADGNNIEAVCQKPQE